MHRGWCFGTEERFCFQQQRITPTTPTHVLSLSNVLFTVKLWKIFEIIFESAAHGPCLHKFYQRRGCCQQQLEMSRVRWWKLIWSPCQLQPINIVITAMTLGNLPFHRSCQDQRKSNRLVQTGTCWTLWQGIQKTQLELLCLLPTSLRCNH